MIVEHYYHTTFVAICHTKMKLINFQWKKGTPAEPILNFGILPYFMSILIQATENNVSYEVRLEMFKIDYSMLQD